MKGVGGRRSGRGWKGERDMGKGFKFILMMNVYKIKKKKTYKMYS